ncbi:MAG: hypothetical protein ACRD4E_10520 [Bryobacteraceae bacterium]
MLLAGVWAICLPVLHVAGQGSNENWQKLKLLELKGRVEDRAQHRGWNLYRVKPQEGEEKQILLANLPYDMQQDFAAWVANKNPVPALQHLETELSTRRADYVAAVNSGETNRVDQATRALETAKDQVNRMRDLSSPDPKDEGFVISARPTGQVFDNIEIWDCQSQKEFDAAYAVALRSRKEQDTRQTEAKARLKADQELAAKNDPDGIFKMAERYYLGDRLAGVKRDLAKAHELYEKAAGMGHADAAIALKHWQAQIPPGR